MEEAVIWRLATGGRCDILAPLYWNFSHSSLKVRGMRPYKMDLHKFFWLSL